ncbi:MAG: rRNA pseudouridine synthase [Candidatus Omnitrophica bacterium]|nr:rRNA pseudouridine synthase [Candidatus Omnitrophota bacterium]
MRKIRLQVALSKAGITSRRKAAEFIESNRVKVNGKIITKKGFAVDIANDEITFNEKRISFKEKKYYYILNKPPGVLSTARDERGRKTVFDYVRWVGARLYPVGRLDKDTRGLIILTNDGDLTYRLTHPKFEIDRIYEVKAKGRVKEEDLLRLEKGVRIDGKLARAQKVVLETKNARFTTLVLTLREGRKREVRRMLKAIGHNVLGLRRIAYGPLRLGTLEEGEVRSLSEGELAGLKKMCGE